MATGLSLLPKPPIATRMIVTHTRPNRHERRRFASLLRRATRRARAAR